MLKPRTCALGLLKGAYNWPRMCLCCLIACILTPGISKDIQFHVWPCSFLSSVTHYKIRYYASYKVGYQPSDCRRALNFPLVMIVHFYACIYATQTSLVTNQRELILTRSTQRAQTSLAEADHYSHIAHCKNVEPWL